MDAKALSASKKVFDLFGWLSFVESAAASGMFNVQGLTPIQSVLKSNVWEVFILAGHKHMVSSLSSS